MPYAGKDFPPLGPDESITLTMDFLTRLAAAETIQVHTWTAETVFGIDPDPASRLVGAPALDGSKTIQRVTNLLSNVRYKLTARIQTSQGNFQTVYAFVDGTDGLSTLVIEDGSNVLGANSYNTLIDLRVYAARRGRIISGDDKKLEQDSFNAMDYLESLRDSYRGTRTNDDQALQWPRADVILLDGSEIGDDVIPDALKAAQCQLVIEIASGVKLFPSSQSLTILQSVKVGPIDLKYLPGESRLRIPAVDQLLEPLLYDAGITLKTLRI